MVKVPFNYSKNNLISTLNSFILFIHMYKDIYYGFAWMKTKNAFIVNAVCVTLKLFSSVS